MTLAYEESAYLDSVTLAPDDLLQYVRVYGYALRFHWGHYNKQLDENCFCIGAEIIVKGGAHFLPSKPTRRSKERFKIF